MALLDAVCRLFTAFFVEAGGVSACTPKTWSGNPGLCFARVLHYSAGYRPEARFHISAHYLLLFGVGIAIPWMATARTWLRTSMMRGMPPVAWRIVAVCSWMMGLGATINMGEMMLSGYVTDYIAIMRPRSATAVQGTAVNIADVLIACAFAASFVLAIGLLLRDAAAWPRRLLARAWPRGSAG